jgi:uncharacterized protein (DUF608 family)
MEKQSSQQCNCSSSEQASSCCPSPLVVNRRQFLQIGGVGFLATTLGSSELVMAGPFGGNDTHYGHLVPADKKFTAKWIRSLYAKGTKEIYKGEALKTIGMPCGGIASGQLYLCGDGTLGDWQIFGNPVSYWVGSTGSTFGVQRPRKPVQQGFAVAIKNHKGKNIVKKLNSEGINDVQFQGDYPIGIVRYADKELPVKVQLEAYSPYIPLNAEDSAYPATILEFIVENTSKETVNAGIMGWLENAVCLSSRMEYDLNGQVRFVKDGDRLALLNGVETESSGKGKPIRPAVVFENFEGENWGEWKVEGDAFGDRPTKVESKLEGQGDVTGAEGKSYANSMHNGDQSKGKLTSKKFTLDRRYICFLLGGGGHPTTTISLMVNGEVVRKSNGWNQEGLQWRGWYVGDMEGKDAQIIIEDSEQAGWGHINVDSIEFTDEPKHGGVNAGSIDYGNMALVCLDGGDGLEGIYPDMESGRYLDKDEVYSLLSGKLPLLRSKQVELKPSAKYTFRFVMSWHFPNIGQEGKSYAEKFKDSQAVASHITSHYPKLRKETYQWRDVLYDSTLPYWLLDRLHSTMSILATGTTRWWKNGRFYAFEGCTCCHGTCTHVWSYAQGHARLFPELARNIRQRQDFTPIAEGGGFYPETGLVGFRGDKDFGFAADGQCGTVLNAYREHQMNADDSFLKANWSKIKKALEYLIEQDAKGEMGGMASPQNAAKASAVKESSHAMEAPDGVITGTQHNTYDINYHGANTLVGSLYLAALRAGEEMAKEMDDSAFAAYTHKLFESGRKYSIEKLWNGEYFTQIVDLKKYPQHQYADGCLSDQVFGQFWAHQVNLGYVYPEENVKQALQSVWKYNWTPDVGPYNEKYKPGRWFISPGQAGLFICTWPKGDYLPEGTMYKDEIWTGIEYQVAANLIWEGFVTEGLAICKAIHDRYQPGFLNPYNEIECGDHYARAMASWGVYLALAGFKYHGPRGVVGFAPKITPENFKAAFTFAEGWASFSQKRKFGKQLETLTMQKGRLKITELSFVVEKGKKVKNVDVAIEGKTLESTFKCDKNNVVIRLAEILELNERQSLDIEIKV